MACPSAHDPRRNQHRCGLAWSKGAVRAILGNPRYTGRQVWNRQRKDEVLIDVHDVALGHTTKMRWNHEDQWIFSEEIVHPLVIDDDTFKQAQQLLAAKNARKTVRRPRSTPRPYILRGLLFCGIRGASEKMHQFAGEIPSHRRGLTGDPLVACGGPQPGRYGRRRGLRGGRRGSPGRGRGARRRA